MVTLLVLLPGTGSAVVLVMVTALVMEPVIAVGTTLSVITPEAPDAKLAKVRVTPLVVVLSVPTLVVADTRVSPAALSASVSVTF
jgi:hypothetical protein